LNSNIRALKHFLLTVDVEDWFQVENLRFLYPCDIWNKQELRVERNTRQLLDLFDSIAGRDGTFIQATFFILGWVAERCPSLVKEIHNRGHEVASHGYHHTLCRQEKLISLRQDLSDSKKLLEDIIGSPVLGYRAPGFSIDEKILTLIKEAGYLYDSSYNSFGLNPRYGQVDFSTSFRENNIIRLQNDFFEIPVSNLILAGKTIPWAGGGYFRFYPSPLFRRGVAKILGQTGAYIFYLHPWELDSGQPRVAGLPLLSRFRHYLNLDKTLPRLQSMIEAFAEASFISCRQMLADTDKLGMSEEEVI
jgi:polysaccharide deacetylase family protein (PEP-CTERM system associated)